MNKKIGIVGLGVIGGSLAKAIKAFTKHIVWGYDADNETMHRALSEGAIDAKLHEQNYSQCDIILIALYPQATIRFFKDHLELFRKGTVIIDCAGVKREICSELSGLADRAGLYFIGGHPMAGIEKSGYQNSMAGLFKGAYMILCQEPHTNMVAIKSAERFFLSIGFAEITITTAEEHDKTIAYTSQLAHLVSNAYVKSPTALLQKGFSAGSYKDLTRVANLNEEMWSELFMANSQFLLGEAEALIVRLEEYISALKQGDQNELKELLRQGRLAKQQAQ